MEDSRSLRIRFEHLSPAEGNRAAGELRTAIERSVQEADVTTVRESEENQDFGATLVVVLGSQAIVELVRAVHSYVAKRGDRVVIETPNGKVVATGSGADNIDVSSTVSALQAEPNDT